MSILKKWFNPTIIKSRDRANSFQESLRSSPREEDKIELKKIQSVIETKEIHHDEESSDLDSFDSDDNIFKDPKVAQYYRDLYESVNYECKDHFDPDFTWTKEEERKVVWKCDWRVTFWAYIMFTALDFDRNNIAQAVSDNILDDLGVTTNDYNIANTINLVCFLASELPSQLISKKIGADIWIPTQLLLFSAVSICQAGITTRRGYFVTRALLGLFQGGFICDACLWMSYFYTSKELPFRISLFYIANPLTSILSALIGFGILRVKTTLLPHGWQWVFLIEGIFTFIIGIASFFLMPASAVQTKAWYRPSGWFTDREEKIVVNRVLRDDPAKGDMNNREPVSLKELFKAITDYDLLPIYLIRLLGDIGSSPVSTYMTLTLKKLGFSTVNTNVLTIPYNFMTIVTMLIIGYLSEIFDSRALLIGTTPLWVFTCTLALRFWPGSQVKVWPTYALLTVLLSHAPIWPLTISWCSHNSNSVRNRAVSAALVNIFSQTAGIISANIYRKDDKPLYHRGNTDLIGISAGAFGLCVFARFYYIWRNKQKDKVWNAMSEEEQEKYKFETTDDSNKRLDFRFVY